MKTLERQLAKLSERAASVEALAKTSRQLMIERSATFARAKADARTKQEAFRYEVQNPSEAIRSHWQDINACLKSDSSEARAHLQSPKDTHFLNLAKSSVLCAENNLEAAVSKALTAIAELEEAVLEVVNADLHTHRLELSLNINTQTKKCCTQGVSHDPKAIYKQA